MSTAQAIVDGLRKDGVLKGKPFENPIDFVLFDLWHYDGRTSKHGAFMGGADFVQWHGNYPDACKDRATALHGRRSAAAALSDARLAEKLATRSRALGGSIRVFNLAFLALDIYIAHP